VIYPIAAYFLCVNTFFCDRKKMPNLHPSAFKSSAQIFGHPMGEKNEINPAGNKSNQ
jgi:hypothetical protein